MCIQVNTLPNTINGAGLLLRFRELPYVYDSGANLCRTRLQKSHVKYDLQKFGFTNRVVNT